LGSFNISNSTVAGSSIYAQNGDTINIISDIDDNDVTDTTKTIYVDDSGPTIYSHSPPNNEYIQRIHTIIFQQDYRDYTP